MNLFLDSFSKQCICPGEVQSLSLQLDREENQDVFLSFSVLGPRGSFCQVLGVLDGHGKGGRELAQVAAFLLEKKLYIHLNSLMNEQTVRLDALIQEEWQVLLASILEAVQRELWDVIRQVFPTLSTATLGVPIGDKYLPSKLAQSPILMNQGKVFDPGTTCSIMLIFPVCTANQCCSTSSLRVVTSTTGDSAMGMVQKETLTLFNAHDMHTLRNPREAERLEKFAQSLENSKETFRGILQQKNSRLQLKMPATERRKSLEPTRSLGHFLFSYLGVIPTPTVSVHDVSLSKGNVDFLVGSDGWWDVFNPAFLLDGNWSELSLDDISVYITNGHLTPDRKFGHLDNATVVMSSYFQNGI